MEKRALGRTGMEVTVLGFGAAEIGYEGAAQETVTPLLNAALDAGLNMIDTAECYGDSEGLIGRAVGHRRKDFFLFTKCGHASGLGHADWSVELLEKSIDRSLERLRTDHVDLVQLHSCSEEVLRRGEVIRVIEKARDAGKTRFVGYSGDHSAAHYAVMSGRFDTLQTSVNIMDQEAIELTIPEARRRNMGIIAKRPIANAVWKHAAKPENGYVHTYWDRLQALRYDFLSGAESYATALRFTLSVAGVATAIVGTSKPERWKQNAEMLKAGVLPRGEFEKIRARWNAVAQADWVGQT